MRASAPSASPRHSQVARRAGAKTAAAAATSEEAAAAEPHAVAPASGGRAPRVARALRIGQVFGSQ